MRRLENDLTCLRSSSITMYYISHRVPPLTDKARSWHIYRQFIITACMGISKIRRSDRSIISNALEDCYNQVYLWRADGHHIINIIARRELRLIIYYIEFPQSSFINYRHIDMSVWRVVAWIDARRSALIDIQIWVTSSYLYIFIQHTEALGRKERDSILCQKMPSLLHRVYTPTPVILNRRKRFRELIIENNGIWRMWRQSETKYIA